MAKSLQYNFLIGLYFISSFLWVSVDGIAQELGVIQSKYYSALDYKAGTQNWSAVQDKRGVMYFGNVNGVLEFNGEGWNLIPLANQSAARSLSIDNQGIVYVGGYNEVGYILPDEMGKMKYHSLLPLIDNSLHGFGEVWDINCFGDTVFILSDRYLFRFVDGMVKFWESSNDGFYLTHSINNELYIQELGIGLMKFEEDTLKLIEKGDYFNELLIHSIFQLDDGFLICTRNNGLYKYALKNGKVDISPLNKISSNARKLNEYFKKHSFYHGAKIGDERIALASISGDLLIVDKDWRIVDVVNNETIGNKSSVLFVYFVDNQYLWLALDNGISLVEVLSPFRFWNESMGVNGVVTDVSRLDNTLYVATGSGIFFTKKSKENPFDLSVFRPVDGNFEQAWEFMYFTPNSGLSQDTILLASTRKGVFEIHESKSINISQYESLQSIHNCSDDRSKLLLGLNDGVAQLTYKNGKWIDQGYRYSLDARISGIEEDSIGNLWLSSDFKGIYRVAKNDIGNLDSEKIDFFDTQHGLPSVSSIRLYQENNLTLFIVDGGYFVFNDTTQRFDPFDVRSYYETGSKTQKELNDSLSWERVWNEILSNFYVTHPEDSVIWFSTNNGLYRYEPGTKRDYFYSPNTIINRVQSNDSLIFEGTNINKSQSIEWLNEGAFLVNVDPSVDLGTVLKHKDNSLSFFYSVPYYEGENPNQYSYWLEGYDKNWSDWSSGKMKEYTNLGHGSYTFKVKSKNIFGVESGIAEFRFTVLPPWYLTYYAFVAYLLLFGLLVYLIVRIYTYRLILEKDRLEVMVKERTQEILIQKEEILVQSEHLKEANEWISAKNLELENQKNEIEKKKNELEISNATKNKFFRIIAHDLRNPISTVVNTTGLIVSNIQEFDKERTKYFVEELNKLSLTTYNLLENLLDWSTSQMGEIKYNPKILELSSIIAENIELVKSKIESKNIDLHVDVGEDIRILADSNMIYTIIRNLISNAVKFTHDNGKIAIEAELKDDFCYLSVSDNGLGISDENLKNLFKIEKDVRTLGTRNERGSGLGLILCKEFVELNGGKIFVESELGKGSKFTISIRLA